jgi:hypothetical protein
MLDKKEINKDGFKNKMKGIAARMNSKLVNGMTVKDGKIKHVDIVDFLENYGEGLLECPKFKNQAFKNKYPNFVFDGNILGADYY